MDRRSHVPLRRRFALLAIATCCVAAAVAQPAGAATLNTTLQDKWAFGQLKDGDPNDNVATAKWLGAKGIRVFAEWGYFARDPSNCRATPPDVDDPNSYPLGEIAGQVARAKANGLDVTLTFDGPIPCWGSLQRDSMSSCPFPCTLEPNPALFRKFVRAVAVRVGNDVSRWAPWNEPNRSDHLTGEGSTALIYRSLWLTAYDEIHTVMGFQAPFYFGDFALRDSDFPFVNQAFCTSPLTYPGGRYPSCTSSSQAPNADALSFHSYLNANDVFPGDNLRVVTNIANLAAGRGMTVAEDEGGVHVCRPGSTPEDCDPHGVSEDTQGDWLNCLQETAWKENDMIAFGQYQLQDQPADGRWYSGLRRRTAVGSDGKGPAGATTPSYYAFRQPLTVKRLPNNDLDTWGGWLRVADRPATLELIGYDAGGVTRYQRSMGLGSNGYFHQSIPNAPGGLTWYTLGPQFGVSRSAHGTDCAQTHGPT